MIQELIEAEAWGDPIDTRAYLNDDPSFGLGSMAAPFTSIDDRADGKLWPIYRVEQDLARIRMVARRLSSVTGTSIGVVDALANYTLGNGYEFKASGAEQSLVASVQAAIDELLNRWQFVGGLDRELHGRSREDGEALVAIERGSDGWPSLLIIEPDCLTEPGDTRSMENYCQDYHSPQSWSFGVRTAARNTAEVLGYHVAFDAGGADWEYYPEARLQHLKRNATRAAKRGVSDWYSVAGDVVREAKLRRNTMQGATLQAAIAWILQSPAGTTEAQSAAIGSGGSVGTYQRSVGNNGPQTYQRKDYPAGSVLTPSAGLEYHPGPMGAERNAGFLEVAQYALRSIGVRWNMPEAMVSGDASNANYASSLVAEAPFVKAREADQAFYSEHFKRLVWKALRFMWECGLLQIPCGFDQLKTLIDIKVDCPKVASRDPQEQASTAAAYVAMGALSVRTASVEAGYDYDQEVSNGAAKAAPPPMPGMPGQLPPMDPNADPSMMLPESGGNPNHVPAGSSKGGQFAPGVQSVSTKGLKVRFRDLKIADENLKTGKGSVTPDDPVDVSYNVDTGELELVDGYHRYLAQRGGSIAAAKDAEHKDIKAKVSFVKNDGPMGSLRDLSDEEAAAYVKKPLSLHPADIGDAAAELAISAREKFRKATGLGRGRATESTEHTERDHEHLCENDMQQAVAIALESVATTAEARGVLSQLMEGGGNPNHDPDDGKFTSGPGGRTSEMKQVKKFQADPVTPEEKAGKLKVFYRFHGDHLSDPNDSGAYSATWGASFITPRFYTPEEDIELDDAEYIGIRLPDDRLKGIGLDSGARDEHGTTHVIDESDWEKAMGLVGDDDYDAFPAIEARRGYSSFEDPSKLKAYFKTRGVPEDETGHVVQYVGRDTGTGDDDEDLSVPVRVVAKMKPSDFFKAKKNG